jgi:hypothetical protein
MVALGPYVEADVQVGLINGADPKQVDLKVGLYEP